MEEKEVGYCSRADYSTDKRGLIVIATFTDQAVTIQKEGLNSIVLDYLTLDKIMRRWREYREGDA